MPKSKMLKREEAAQRAKARDSRTANAQIERLDTLGFRAARERARLGQTFEGKGYWR